MFYENEIVKRNCQRNTHKTLGHKSTEHDIVVLLVSEISFCTQYFLHIACLCRLPSQYILQYREQMEDQKTHADTQFPFQHTQGLPGDDERSRRSTQSQASG